MKYNPKIHNRQSIRLKGWDYSHPGLYFITICAQNHTHLFGYIQNKKMHLNDAGKMVEKWYFEMENKYPNIKCDEHIVMPNHFHCIMMDWFKTMTTNAYIRGVKSENWPRFEKRVWQKRYWDHIIRNENDYIRISAYIINNPKKWTEDKFNK